MRASLSDPLLYEEVNCAGTLSILNAMKTHDVRRLVVASSSSVYGGTTDIPFREDIPLGSPPSPYAATKLACEHYCRFYHDMYGISATALRRSVPQWPCVARSQQTTREICGLDR